MAVRDQLPASQQHNTLIPLALGLYSRLDALANQLAESALPSDDRTLDSSHDSLVFAALGIVSVRETVRRWLDIAGAEHLEPHGTDVQPGEGSTAGPDRLESLLR